MLRWVALVNSIIPLLAVFGAYAISFGQGLVPGCVPFFEGCLSISRGARSGDAIYWFRGIMMPLVPIYMLYWWLQTRWLKAVTGHNHREIVAVLLLGFISGIALILYTDFLGSDGAFYELMRRQGVMLYFGFAALAQLLSLHILHWNHYQPEGSERFGWRLQWAAVGVQWVLGLLSVANSALQPSFKSEVNNALEWCFALAMVTFYFASYWVWSRAFLHIRLVAKEK